VRHAIRSARFGATLDELAAAIERYSPVIDADRPRLPERDDQAGTTTFFADQRDQRALRRRYLRSMWQLPLMLCPAVAGLLLLRQWPLAAVVLTVAGGLEVRLWRKLAELARLLKLSRAGRGRLLLTPEHVTWPGTNVAIPWSHVQGATVVRGQRPGLDGRVACPDPVRSL
jgi:hypothetical protein